MLFNSIDFGIYLPVVFLLYWLVFNKELRLRNLFLLVISYIFYGWWDWRFLSLIIFSSFLDYFVGLKLSTEEAPSKRKAWLFTSVIVNLGLLGFFKYFNFFAESFAEAFTMFGMDFKVSSLNIILPVGISFYTFQTMSYTLDIYRNRFKATSDLIAFLAFVSFFPQLVAGPIERASHLLPQFFYKKHFSYDLVSQGLKIALWGFFMKVVVADRLSLYVEAIYGHPEVHTGLSFIVATIFFAIQIYCDFGGYSLIAIGCAQMFGFSLMDNFRRPYFAGTFKDFWSRWHISLSTWFKDYLYIPLGGNRGSNARTYFNLFTTFVISGLWHGANWTFVIWGALHGVYQIAEKGSANITKNIKIPRLISIAFVFFFTCIAWVFFRAATVEDAFHILTVMFTNLGDSIHIGDKGIFAFSILGILTLFTVDFFNEYQPNVKLLNHEYAFVRITTIVAMLAFIIGLGVFDGGQFIYFQF